MATRSLLLALAIVPFAVGCAAEPVDDSTRGEGDDMFQAESIDSMRQVLIDAHSAGVACADLPMAGAIAYAESGLSTTAKNWNGPTSGCPHGSLDRGLWQINGCYHPDVSDACAYDGACNARAMASISAHGTNWKPWSTYWNGAYKAHLSAAKAAYASGIPGCTGGGGGGSSAGASCQSGTLGRSVGEHTCVQSKFDDAWYTCVGGQWDVGKGVSGGCSATYPLAGSSGTPCWSNTLGRSEPEHACVQSKFDSEWYTCIDGTWRYGKGVSGGCSAAYPL